MPPKFGQGLGSRLKPNDTSEDPSKDAAAAQSPAKTPAKDAPAQPTVSLHQVLANKMKQLELYKKKHALAPSESLQSSISSTQAFIDDLQRQISASEPSDPPPTAPTPPPAPSQPAFLRRPRAEAAPMYPASISRPSDASGIKILAVGEGPDFSHLRRPKRSGASSNANISSAQPRARVDTSAVLKAAVTSIDSKSATPPSASASPLAPAVAAAAAALRVRLKQYQERGVLWMLGRETGAGGSVRGGLLADDCGLGKTLQLVATVAAAVFAAAQPADPLAAAPSAEHTYVGFYEELARRRGAGAATLVVCPKAVLAQWPLEAAKYLRTHDQFRQLCSVAEGAPAHRRALSLLGASSWSPLAGEPLLRVRGYHGAARAKEQALLRSRGADAADVWVTTYGTLRAEHGHAGPGGAAEGLLSVSWGRVVFDEAHTLRNMRTATYKAAHALRLLAEQPAAEELPGGRWLLTATPLHNAVDDLQSVFALLRVHPFAQPHVWKHLFAPVQRDARLVAERDAAPRLTGGRTEGRQLASAQSLGASLARYAADRGASGDGAWAALDAEARGVDAEEEPPLWVRAALGEADPVEGGKDRGNRRIAALLRAHSLRRLRPDVDMGLRGALRLPWDQGQPEDDDTGALRAPASPADVPESCSDAGSDSDSEGDSEGDASGSESGNEASSSASAHPPPAVFVYHRVQPSPVEAALHRALRGLAARFEDRRVAALLEADAPDADADADAPASGARTRASALVWLTMLTRACASVFLLRGRVLHEAARTALKRARDADPAPPCPVHAPADAQPVAAAPADAADEVDELAALMSGLSITSSASSAPAQPAPPAPECTCAVDMPLVVRAAAAIATPAPDAPEGPAPSAAFPAPLPASLLLLHRGLAHLYHGLLPLAAAPRLPLPYAPSAKLAYLLLLLSHLALTQPGAHVLVFSQWTGVLDVVQHALSAHTGRLHALLRSLSPRAPALSPPRGYPEVTGAGAVGAAYAALGLRATASPLDWELWPQADAEREDERVARKAGADRAAARLYFDSAAELDRPAAAGPAFASFSRVSRIDGSLAVAAQEHEKDCFKRPVDPAHVAALDRALAHATRADPVPASAAAPAADDGLSAALGRMRLQEPGSAAEDSPLRLPLSILLISTSMGGAGLNLVEASHVVHFDPPWNPATRIQASARAQRLGQRRTVVVHDLALQGALEPRVLAVRRRKRGLAEAVVDGADGKAAGPGLTLREIRELFA